MAYIKVIYGLTHHGYTVCLVLKMHSRRACLALPVEIHRHAKYNFPEHSNTFGYRFC